MSRYFGMHVKGLNRVLGQMSVMISDLRFHTKQGLIRGAFLIIAESGRINPVDLGNLRASSFVVWDTTKAQPGNFRAGEDGEGADVGQLVFDHQRVQQAELTKTVRLSLTHDALVILGYTANYAIYVHEDPNASHENGQVYKFLEKAVDMNFQAILQAIETESKKGLI